MSKMIINVKTILKHVLFDDNNNNCINQIQPECGNAKILFLTTNLIYHWVSY
jgi:hypothetical protein